MIVDAHTHFYDPSRAGGVPWPPRDERLLYRTVLPEHFRTVAEPAGVTGTVVVEASPRLEDNQWILDLAAADPTILGFVGNLDLRSPDFPAWVERFAADPLFRGIRARGVDLEALEQRAVLDNLRVLAAADLSLDLLPRTADLPRVESLSDAVTGLRIVLDHVAHVPIDGDEPDPAWRGGMERLAERPGVFCKVSRLTEAAINWPAPTDPVFYRPTLAFLWDSFGPDRLLWGSNWPVAEKAGDYATTLSVVTAFLADASAGERDALLWKTSQAVYRRRVR